MQDSYVSRDVHRFRAVVNRAGRLSLGRFELAAASIGARHVNLRSLPSAPRWQIATIRVVVAMAFGGDRCRRHFEILR